MFKGLMFQRLMLKMYYLQSYFNPIIKHSTVEI